MSKSNTRFDPASILATTAVALAALLVLGGVAATPVAGDDTTASAVETSQGWEIVKNAVTGWVGRVTGNVKHKVSPPDPVDPEKKGEWLNDWMNSNNDEIENYVNTRMYAGTATDVIELNIEQPRSTDTRYVVYDSINGTMKRLRVQSSTARTPDMRLWISGDLTRDLDTALPDLYSSTIASNKTIGEGDVVGTYCRYSDDIEWRGIEVREPINKCSILGG